MESATCGHFWVYFLMLGPFKIILTIVSSSFGTDSCLQFSTNEPLNSYESVQTSVCVQSVQLMQEQQHHCRSSLHKPYLVQHPHLHQTPTAYFSPDCELSSLETVLVVSAKPGTIHSYLCTSLMTPSCFNREEYRCTKSLHVGSNLP